MEWTRAKQRWFGYCNEWNQRCAEWIILKLKISAVLKVNRWLAISIDECPQVNFENAILLSSCFFLPLWALIKTFFQQSFASLLCIASNWSSERSSVLWLKCKMAYNYLHSLHCSQIRGLADLHCICMYMKFMHSANDVSFRYFHFESSSDWNWFSVPLNFDPLKTMPLKLK